MYYNYEKTSDIKPINNDYLLDNPNDLYDKLMNVWCIDTCAPRFRDKYLKSHKTLGQCSITSFLVQDIFGGEVYGVPLKDGGYHCFNVVEGIMFDLTNEQFAHPLTYSLDYTQSREVHFKDQDKYERYLLLKNKLNGEKI